MCSRGILIPNPQYLNFRCYWTSLVQLIASAFLPFSAGANYPCEMSVPNKQGAEISLLMMSVSGRVSAARHSRPEPAEVCVAQGAEAPGSSNHWAGPNSNSLMPAEMWAWLNPSEMNGEVPKDVNGRRLNKKNTSAGRRKKTLICI